MWGKGKVISEFQFVAGSTNSANVSIWVAHMRIEDYLPLVLDRSVVFRVVSGFLVHCVGSVPKSNKSIWITSSWISSASRTCWSDILSIEGGNLQSGWARQHIIDYGGDDELERQATKNV